MPPGTEADKEIADTEVIKAKSVSKEKGGTQPSFPFWDGLALREDPAACRHGRTPTTQ